MTQEDLAQAAGLSVRSVSDLERGVNVTALRETARLLAGALGLAGDAKAEFEAAARSGVAGFPGKGTAAVSGIATATAWSGPWRFPGKTAITSACAELPKALVERIPYSNPDDPHYTELSGYADKDSLVELNGHIQRLNPDAPVRIRAPSLLAAGHYHTHLVAVGGTDWNALTRTALATLGLPVRQVADWDIDLGQYFEADEHSITARHLPVLEKTGGRATLREDVALFARAASPFSQGCTITICCGMYARGTFGVTRAVTDESVRDRNIRFLHSRFRDNDTYCLLTRIPVVDGQSVPPDWTLKDTILYTWSR
jgi:DNA-binding XRE family transcriptional regulator